MPKEIIVALIAAAVPIGIAIWALLTAKKMRTYVLAAEESAKRTELIGIKALEAVDSILQALSEMIAAVGGIRFMVEHGAIPDDSRAVEALRPIGENRTKIKKLRLRFAPYLTEKLLSQFDRIFARTESMEFSLESLIELERDLTELADSIAVDARTRFLNAA